MDQRPVRKSVFIEDIDNSTGESVEGGACVVYSVTVISDAGAAGVITFHDGTSQAADKKHEIKVAANGTVHCAFPRGKKFDTGLFVKSNKASIDLSIDFD